MSTSRPARRSACSAEPTSSQSRSSYWLSHPEERAAVAEAGYRRALAEHTYDHRFAAIFSAANLA